MATVKIGTLRRNPPRCPPPPDIAPGFRPDRPNTTCIYISRWMTLISIRSHITSSPAKTVADRVNLTLQGPWRPRRVFLRHERAGFDCRAKCGDGRGWRGSRRDRAVHPGFWLQTAAGYHLENAHPLEARGPAPSGSRPSMDEATDKRALQRSARRVAACSSQRQGWTPCWRLTSATARARRWSMLGHVALKLGIAGNIASPTARFGSVGAHLVSFFSGCRHLRHARVVVLAGSPQRRQRQRGAQGACARSMGGARREQPGRRC